MDDRCDDCGKIRDCCGNCGCIPADIRAELDQTPAWWESQFQALVRKNISREPAAHVGHDLHEEDEFTLLAASGERYVYNAGHTWCATCRIELDRAR